MTSEKSSLEILYSVSRNLATSLDLHTVLEQVLSIATSNTGAERASLIVLDESGKPIDAAIMMNGALTPTTVEQMHDVITSGLAGWVIQNKEIALLNNTETDKRWLSRPDGKQKISPGKSALCIPIMAHEELVGVLTIVQPYIDFFTNEDVALQKSITEMAGISIENARLFRSMQNTQQRYHDLFEKSLDAVFITSLEGRILEANNEACLMTGQKVKPLTRLSISEIQTPIAEFIGKNYERIPAQDSLSFESNILRQDKTYLPVEVHVSHIIINDHDDLQWIFRNIEEQKKIIQMRDDLSAMLYHDLRSPLANIISSLDIMNGLFPVEESESLRSVFDVAKRSTERMQRMIDGLLDINHLEAGQQITVKKCVSISSVIDEAEDVTQGIANNKQITLVKEISEKIPSVNIDPDMIRRVIINLTENAIKFSPNQSIVRIGAKKDKKFLQVYVDDQGKGIPEDSKVEIFEKFVRLKENYPIKGLGLGLAFCKLAVQAHGGKIWVENIPQGGSRFVFTLPLT